MSWCSCPFLGLAKIRYNSTRADTCLRNAYVRLSRTCTQMHVYYNLARAFECTYTPRSTHTSTHMHARTHARTHTHTHVHTFTHIHTFSLSYTHLALPPSHPLQKTCAHTHTHTTRTSTTRRFAACSNILQRRSFDPADAN